uniref:Integral membrane protein n=1 Tax=Bionectria ochroleuca TaxID=29856 RepID=A0A0B7KBB2_BIOOC
MDPTNTPVISPPPGTSSNFVDPPDQLAAVYVTSALVLVLATGGLSARLFVKLFIIPDNRIEYWLSYLAYASFIAYVAVLLHLSRMGVTRHIILYWTNVVYCIYSVPTAAVKLSVLFQVKSIRKSIYWVRAAIWLGDTVEGKCTDAIQAIWHLSMPVKRKLSAFAVFAVSLIAIGTGIGGMYIRVVLLSNIDQTWWLAKLAMIVTTEISIVMFVGCMRFIPRLYHHFRGPSLHTTTTASSSKGGVQTFGGSGDKTGDGKLSRTVAKYMGSRGAGMTTPGSRGGGASEDELELRRHEDVERGDGAQSNHNIYQTSRGHTYTTRTEDWRGR